MSRVTKRRALIALLVLAGVSAFVAVLALSPKRAAVQHDPFVGTWTLMPPDESGISKLLTLEENGRFTTSHISESSGKVVPQLSGRWSVDHGMLLLWTDDDDNVLRKLVGLPRKRVPIFLTGPDEFKIGDRADPHRWRRCAIEQPRLP